MHCEKIEMLLPLLAVDGLDPQQKAEVLAHLVGCERCRERLEELRAAARVLREALSEEPALSDERRSALLLAVADQEKKHAGRRIRPFKVAARGFATIRKGIARLQPKSVRESVGVAVAATMLILLVAGMLLPALSRAREDARSICRSNLREMEEVTADFRPSDAIAKGGEAPAAAPAPCAPAEQIAEAASGPGVVHYNGRIWAGEKAEGKKAEAYAFVAGRPRRAKTRWFFDDKFREIRDRDASVRGRIDERNGYLKERDRANRNLQAQVSQPLGERDKARADAKVQMDKYKHLWGEAHRERQAAWAMNDSGLGGGGIPVDRFLRAEPEDAQRKSEKGNSLLSARSDATVVYRTQQDKRKYAVDVDGDSSRASGEKAHVAGSLEDRAKELVAGARERYANEGRPPILMNLPLSKRLFTDVESRERSRSEVEKIETAAKKGASVRAESESGRVAGAGKASAFADRNEIREKRAESNRSFLGSLLRRRGAPRAALEQSQPDGAEFKGQRRRGEESALTIGGRIARRKEEKARPAKAAPADETGGRVALQRESRPASAPKPVVGDSTTTQDINGPMATQQARPSVVVKVQGKPPEQIDLRAFFEKGHKRDNARKSPTTASPEKPAVVVLPPAEVTVREAPAPSQPLAPTPESKVTEEPPPPREGEPSRPVFRAVPVNPWEMAARDALSTFAIDVDTASYGIARSYLRRDYLPPAASVRMEEFVNNFDYNYTQRSRDVFTVDAAAAPSPFGRGLTLLKIGIRGKVIGREARKPAHLVFVVDASGSMARADRMPLVQYSLNTLIAQLGAGDRVTLIAYGTKARLILDAVPAKERARIEKANDSIRCGGSTNLYEGLRLGYRMAAQRYRSGAVNRVILCSDGVANVGSTTAEELLDNVRVFREQGVTFTAVGFGAGAYNDVLMETLADNGDGNYVFVDSRQEARRVFVEEMSATLNTIAKDAKIQVQFNPARVRRYRLIGFENRAIADQDFRNDAVDAGEVGSGQSATALYELELLPAEDSESSPDLADLGTAYVRYRNLETGKIEEISQRLPNTVIRERTPESDPRFFLAACAAEFAEILRESEHAKDGNFNAVAHLLSQVAAALPLDARVQELVWMVNKARGGLPRGN